MLPVPPSPVDLANALTNLQDVKNLCYLREVSIARERAENRGHWWALEKFFSALNSDILYIVKRYD